MHLGWGCLFLVIGLGMGQAVRFISRFRRYVRWIEDSQRCALDRGWIVDAVRPDDPDRNLGIAARVFCGPAFQAARSHRLI